MAGLTTLGIILTVIIISVYVVFTRRRRERRLLIEAFSKFIYQRTIDAILDGTESELNEDGLWIREHEPELVSRYGSLWIAVVRKQILATGATGEEAWNAAMTRDPSRQPFVKRLSAVANGLVDEVGG